MTSNAASIAAMTFEPKKAVSVQVGKISMMMYPKIDASMPIWERAHAFHLNRSACASSNADQNTQLEALGSQLNLESIVDGSRADFQSHFTSNWMNMQHLRILSFHDIGGHIIPPATCCTVADPVILKPVINGNLADCRPADIKFVRVQLSLDFAHLITAPLQPGAQPPSSTLRTEYYIELPQSQVNLVNGGGNAYVLSTYTGPADLRTLSVDDMRNTILGPCLQDCPLALLAADFNLPGSVRTDESTIQGEINKKILKLAFHQICFTLFATLCPNYTSQPHAAVDVIKQSYIDADGNRVSTSVFAYHLRMTLAMRPFVSARIFPVSVCNKFMQGLDPRILSYFEGFYPAHNDFHELTGQVQRDKLHLIYLAAIQAENAYNVTTAAARDAVGAAPQSYCSSVVPAHASQAENTLRRYNSASPSTPSKSMRGKCFGCNSPSHMWMDKEGNIICPKRNDSGVKAAADAAYTKFSKEAKTRRAKRAAKDNADFDSMSEAHRDKIRKQVYAADAASVASSITSPSINPSTPSAGSNPQPRVTQTFLLEALVPSENPTVGAYAAPARRTLPAPVTTSLAHIVLPLGRPDDENLPGAICLVDTAAGLTTGSLKFLANIARQYPHIVAKIYAPEDYTPITLSGIVSKDSVSFTTDLNVGFEFHLPYLNREGSNIKIFFAAGLDVTINSVIGLPFIKAVGGIVDTVTDLFEMKYLDCAPLKLFYHRTRNSFVPPKEYPIPSGEHSVQVIQEVDAIEAYMANPPLDSITRRSVMFQDAVSLQSTNTARTADVVGNDPTPINRWIPAFSAHSNLNEYYDPLLDCSAISK